MRAKPYPTDRQPPRKSFASATGQTDERFSEYFDFKAFPEKRDRKVTRAELLAVLTRQWVIQRETRWYRRFWRYLTARRGTKPAPIGGGSDNGSNDA